MRPTALRTALAATLLAAASAALPRAHDEHDHAPPAAAADRAPAKPESPAGAADLRRAADLAALRLHEAKRAGEHEAFRAAEAAYRALIEASSEGSAAGSPDGSPEGSPEGSDVLADAHVGLAYALLGQHRFEESLASARAAAELRPDAPETPALLGDVHFALGNYAEAELAYRGLLAREVALPSLSRVAQVDWQRGHLDAAQRGFEQALEAGALLDAPVASRAWCLAMLGELALERGRVDAAEERFEAALRFDPRTQAATHGLARVALERGDLARAEALLSALAREHPHPRTFMELGEVLTGEDRTDEARTWFDAAEADMLGDLASGDVGHVRDLAELYLRHLDRPEEAVALARRDLETVRHDSATYETLAWALHVAGRPAEALDPIRRALRPGPSSPRLLSRAALVFAANGLADEARDCLETATRLFRAPDAEPLTLDGPAVRRLARLGR